MNIYIEFENIPNMYLLWLLKARPSELRHLEVVAAASI